MHVAFDTGVTPVIEIGVDGDLICDFPDVIGAFIFRVGDCPGVSGLLDRDRSSCGDPAFIL